MPIIMNLTYICMGLGCVIVWKLYTKTISVLHYGIEFVMKNNIENDIFIKNRAIASAIMSIAGVTVLPSFFLPG